jgi:hypothetical protein
MLEAGMLPRQVHLAILLSLSILGTVPPSPTFAQSNEELFAFNRQVDKLIQAGRHSEALATAQRALSLVERRFGADHPHFAAGGPLPFDLARAHALYVALFGAIEDLVKDKHLLIVPSGPLTAIPFQALVTEKPATALPGWLRRC